MFPGDNLASVERIPQADWNPVIFGYNASRLGMAFIIYGICLILLSSNFVFKGNYLENFRKFFTPQKYIYQFKGGRLSSQMDDDDYSRS